MLAFATEKDVEIRGPVGDWHALKSNRDYKANWHAQGGALTVAGSAGFALRAQSEADLKAARWGLLAWEDPRERSRFKPFWIDEKMLIAVVVEPGDPVGMIARATGMAVSGPRLLDGALVLKVKRRRGVEQIWDTGERKHRAAWSCPRGGGLDGAAAAKDWASRAAPRVWPGRRPCATRARGCQGAAGMGASGLAGGGDVVFRTNTSSALIAVISMRRSFCPVSRTSGEVFPMQASINDAGGVESLPLWLHPNPQRRANGGMKVQQSHVSQPCCGADIGRSRK